jgi:hypothetical protein
MSGGLNLTPTDARGHSVHVMATRQAAKALPKVQSATPALSYNGGPIMGSIQIYNIFWVGALNSPGLAGSSAYLSSNYTTAANNLANDYAGHTIDANNTQYYQSSPPNYVHGVSVLGAPGSFGGSYTDTSSFPASGCTDSMTPNDCITDAQIVAEITKVMGIMGWTGASNKMYVVYTGAGEGSCFDSGSTSCAYTAYCGYHGYFTNGSQTVIYANMPYAGMSGCEVSSYPTGHIAADSVVNVASHEITEAITDPLLNAWWDTVNGYEIGDLCAWTFGANGYGGGTANQQWNGNLYELQLEYNNHNAACVQVGPN